MTISFVEGTKTPALGAFTVTIASPAVFTYTGHQLGVGDKVVLSTTGALPTGLTAGTTYFVIAAGLTANAFEVSTTDGGAAVNTSGTQSGTHSLIAEHILADSAGAGVYELRASMASLADQDVAEIRIKAIVLSTDTPPGDVEHYVVVKDAQLLDSDKRQIAIVAGLMPHAVSGALRATLRQPSGAPRPVKWCWIRSA
jgi:hypothetical protein